MGDEWYSGEGVFARFVMSGQLVSLVEILTRCYFKTSGEKTNVNFPWASITIACVKYVNSHLV